MNWYKRYKLSQYMDYTDIGHTSPFEEDLTNKVFSGCNQIWGIFTDESFKCYPETKEKDLHELHGIVGDNLVYKGRIDTCKSVASLICIGSCNPYYKNYNPLFQKKCDQIKVKAITNIQKRFGTNIRIQEF